MEQTPPPTHTPLCLISSQEEGLVFKPLFRSMFILLFAGDGVKERTPAVFIDAVLVSDDNATALSVARQNAAICSATRCCLQITKHLVKTVDVYSKWVEEKSFKTERNDVAVYVIMTQYARLQCSIYIQAFRVTIWVLHTNASIS